jgi:RNA polymerase sigma-70 factor, ECF subfamily
LKLFGQLLRLIMWTCPHLGGQLGIQYRISLLYCTIIYTYMDTESDEQLVTSVQNGSIHAYETLVRRYQHRLFVFALRIMNDPHAAEEVVQDAFLSIYRTIDRIDTDKKFSSYVYKITHNEAVSYLRSKKSTVPLEDNIMTDEDITLYENLIQSEQRSQIRKAMDALEPRYKKVLELYYFDELQYDEIGKRLGLPVNTVRTHLRRAKVALREEYIA